MLRVRAMSRPRTPGTSYTWWCAAAAGSSTEIAAIRSPSATSYSSQLGYLIVSKTSQTILALGLSFMVRRGSSPGVSVISSKPYPCSSAFHERHPLSFSRFATTLLKLPHVQVAPARNPLLRLLDRQCAYQPQARFPVGEDPH